MFRDFVVKENVHSSRYPLAYVDLIWFDLLFQVLPLGDRCSTRPFTLDSAKFHSSCHWLLTLLASHAAFLCFPSELQFARNAPAQDWIWWTLLSIWSHQLPACIYSWPLWQPLNVPGFGLKSGMLWGTTSLADVADMAATGFSDMWNPEQLYYDGEVGRIFHRKWHGLSFAHEVEYEQGEDPIGNFAPIAERMRSLGTTKFLDTSFVRGWVPQGLELLIFASFGNQLAKHASCWPTCTIKSIKHGTD